MIPRIPPPSIARTLYLARLYPHKLRNVWPARNIIWFMRYASFGSLQGWKTCRKHTPAASIASIHYGLPRLSRLPRLYIDSRQQVEIATISAYPVKIRIAVIPTHLYFEIWDTPVSRFSIPGHRAYMRFAACLRRIRACRTRAGECVYKSGLADFAAQLASLGVEIVSTGGTARFCARMESRPRYFD